MSLGNYMANRSSQKIFSKIPSIQKKEKGASMKTKINLEAYFIALDQNFTNKKNALLW